MNGLAFYLLIDLCANTGLNELILADFFDIINETFALLGDKK